VGQELVALAINLGSNKRNVEHITEEELHGLVDRALRCEDTKLLKFCRNILQNSENKQLMEVGKVTHPVTLELPQRIHQDRHDQSQKRVATHRSVRTHGQRAYWGCLERLS
jgi:hypothetical protein